MTTPSEQLNREEIYRQAIAADVDVALSGFPRLTAPQCDRVAILLWSLDPVATPVTPPRIA
jgi:hypothetical protein